MSIHSPKFLELVESAKSNVREITLDQYISKSEAFKLVDVREDREWNEGHIPNAIHLGKGIIERDIEQTFPDFQTPIVLYCGGGFRSILAGEQLKKMGYSQIYSMIGGWKAWLAHTTST